MGRRGLVSAVDAALTEGFRLGRKVASVVAGVTLGAGCIDDVWVLRCGQTERVLGFKAMSPEIVGQWLRSLSWETVRQLDRQLDRLIEQAIERSWALGVGPGEERVTLDFDSSLCEVYGAKKEGVVGVHGRVGYHPLLCTRSDTGEMVGGCARARRMLRAARKSSSPRTCVARGAAAHVARSWFARIRRFMCMT